MDTATTPVIAASVAIPWAVVAPILIAFVGLLGVAVGFLGNNFLATRQLKKEISLKVAEYRLAWINNLGEQFAAYISAAVRLADVERPDTGESARVHQDMTRAATRIHLLMNIQDEHYEELQSLMDQIEEIVWVSRGVGNEKLHESWRQALGRLQQQFVLVANVICKREWSRTKAHLRADTVEVSALKSTPRQAD